MLHLVSALGYDWACTMLVDAGASVHLQVCTPCFIQPELHIINKGPVLVGNCVGGNSHSKCNRAVGVMCQRSKLKPSVHVCEPMPVSCSSSQDDDINLAQAIAGGLVWTEVSCPGWQLHASRLNFAMQAALPLVAVACTFTVVTCCSAAVYANLTSWILSCVHC